MLLTCAFTILNAQDSPLKKSFEEIQEDYSTIVIEDTASMKGAYEITDENTKIFFFYEDTCYRYLVIWKEGSVTEDSLRTILSSYYTYIGGNKWEDSSTIVELFYDDGYPNSIHQLFSLK